MRAWWGVLAALALIALGYVGDRVVGAAFEEAGWSSEDRENASLGS